MRYSRITGVRLLMLPPLLLKLRWFPRCLFFPHAGGFFLRLIPSGTFRHGLGHLLLPVALPLGGCVRDSVAWTLGRVARVGGAAERDALRGPIRLRLYAALPAMLCVCACCVSCALYVARPAVVTWAVDLDCLVLLQRGVLPWPPLGLACLLVVLYMQAVSLSALRLPTASGDGHPYWLSVSE